MASKKVTFYVQLEPEWYDGTDADGRRSLYAAHAARMTTRQPGKPLPGAVVVPVVLWVDEYLFGPQAEVHAQVVASESGVELRAVE